MLSQYFAQCRHLGPGRSPGWGDQEVFCEVAEKLAGDTLEFPNIRAIISRLFNIPEADEVSKTLASEVIDFTSKLGLTKAEAIGKSPAVYMPPVGGSGGYSYGGYVQNVFVLTDKGRKYLAFLTLEHNETK